MSIKKYCRAKYSLFILIPIAVLLVFIIYPKEKDLLTVHFIDARQGGAILIQMPNGSNMLIDVGGPNGEFEDKAGMGSRVVLPYLRYYRVDALDVLVITHPH